MPSSAPPKEAKSVIAQEFLVEEPCALSVNVPGAHVRLRPGRDQDPDQDQDRVEVDISVSGCPPDEAEDILNRMAVGTQQMNNTVRVYSNGDPSDAEWWRWVRTLDVTVHVELRLPSSIEADLNVPGGEIDIADLEGHFDLEVMGGECRVENLKGSLDIRAESSDVSVTGCSGDQLLARVAVGSITVRDAETETTTLRSVSAPIQLTNVEGTTQITANSTSVDIDTVTGPCTVRCQGGPVSYTGAPTHESALTVVGSTLTVKLPSDHPADLTLTGETISLDSAFSFEGETTDHKVEGQLNGGGSALTLRGIGGTVECRPS